MAVYKIAPYPNLESCPSWIPNLPDEKNDLTLHLDQSELVLQGEADISVTFNLSRDQLPPVILYPKILSDLRKSTRSCITQSGVFFDIEPSFCLSQEQIEALYQSQTVQVPGFLSNHGPVSLIYKNKDKIGRLYHVNPTDKIIGTDLEDLISTGIFIGIKGIDYNFLYHDHEAIGITLKVGEKRHYLPISSKPLRISSRHALYSPTKIINPNTSSKVKNHPFHLMETTAQFNLPDQVFGSISYLTLQEDAIHLPSRLIDSGSQWIVRLEIDGDIK